MILFEKRYIVLTFKNHELTNLSEYLHVMSKMLPKNAENTRISWVV